MPECAGLHATRERLVLGVYLPSLVHRVFWCNDYRIEVQRSGPGNAPCIVQKGDSALGAVEREDLLEHKVDMLPHVRRSPTHNVRASLPCRSQKTEIRLGDLSVKQSTAAPKHRRTESTCMRIHRLRLAFRAFHAVAAQALVARHRPPPHRCPPKTLSGRHGQHLQVS